MRQILRRLCQRFQPEQAPLFRWRWLRPFDAALRHPRLWHLNRHSAAGGIAVGLFCGLIPGPLQMPGAAVAALLLRVNLPLALVCTLYTNPFTIVPLYYLAYRIGALFSANGDSFTPPPEPDWSTPADWLAALFDWLIALGQPLAIGLPLLAAGLAGLGYTTVKALWRLHLLRTWRQRHPGLPPGRCGRKQ